MNNLNSVGQLICLGLLLDIGPLAFIYFAGDDPIPAVQLKELVDLGLINKNDAKRQYEITNIGKTHIETLLKQPVY